MKGPGFVPWACSILYLLWVSHIGLRGDYVLAEFDHEFLRMPMRSMNAWELHWLKRLEQQRSCAASLVS